MALRFPPNPGDVVICDFSTGFRPPEMVKRRPALVVSPRLRHRPTLCSVIPLSTTSPTRPVDYQCEIALPVAPPKPFSAVRVWAKADMVATVSLDRLDLFRTQRNANGQRTYFKITVNDVDLDRVRACLKRALGLT